MSRLAVPDRRYDDAQIRDWANDVGNRVVTGAFAWTPGLVGANATVTTILTTTDTNQVRDLRPTMAIAITPPASLDAGLVAFPLASAASDRLTIRVTNTTAGPITPASGTWMFWAFQT